MPLIGRLRCWGRPVVPAPVPEYNVANFTYTEIQRMRYDTPYQRWT